MKKVVAKYKNVKTQIKQDLHVQTSLVFLNNYFKVIVLTWAVQSFTNMRCIKRVQIRSFSDPCFILLELITEIYPAYRHIQSGYGKIRTKVILFLNTFQYRDGKMKLISLKLK